MEEKATDVAEQKADAPAQQQAETKRTYSDEEFKKLVSERDKAKERLRLIDEAAKKADEEKKISEGKAQELLAEKEAQLKDLGAKAKAYEEEQGKLRDSLLAKLSDEADKLVAPKLSVTELARLVELRQSKPTGPDGSKGKPNDKESLDALFQGSPQEVHKRLRDKGLAF